MSGNELSQGRAHLPGKIRSNDAAPFITPARLPLIGVFGCGVGRVHHMVLLVLGALIVAALLHSSPASALSPDEQLKNQSLEHRARELSAELRCLVCQNQSIDDSDAPLAKDLRRIVRERIVAGDTNAQVKTFLVERYGDFVLLKPPFNLHTLLLWLTPALVLGATLLYVVPAMRRSARPLSVTTSGEGAGSDATRLSAQEEARLAELMTERDAAPPVTITASGPTAKQ